MKTAISCVTAVLLLGACGAGASGRFVDDTYGYEPARTVVSESSLPISRIGTYTNSSIQEQRRLIIRGEQEWRDFWYDLNLGSAPEVDFTRDMVIAVSAGSRSSTGYSVLVNDVRLDESGTLRIEVLETTPGRNCVTGQQMTQPVDVVVVPRTEMRTWSFTDRREVRDC
jgi:hypothetical protein